jgi:hypothetical protein
MNMEIHHNMLPVCGTVGHETPTTTRPEDTMTTTNTRGGEGSNRTPAVTA